MGSFWPNITWPYGGSLPPRGRHTAQARLPQSLSALARRALDIITLTFVGRLGPDAMAAAALATSTNNVIAFSVFVGLSTATMTLTSQAKGAGDDAQAGYWLHRALLIHAAAAVPMTILVLLLAPILTLLHQDPVLASAAGSYAANLIPSMWAFGATFVLMPWLQVYSVVRMPLAVSLLIVPLHVGLLQLLINTLGFGVLGAARASSISATLNVVTVALIAGSCLRDHLPFRAVARASCALVRLPSARLARRADARVVGERDRHPPHGPPRRARDQPRGDLDLPDRQRALLHVAAGCVVRRRHARPKEPRGGRRGGRRRRGARRWHASPSV